MMIVLALLCALPAAVEAQDLFLATRPASVASKIPYVVTPKGGKFPMLGMGDGKGWGRPTDWAEWFNIAGKGARIHSAWGYGTQQDIPPALAKAGISREGIYLSSMIPCGKYAGGPEPINASLAEQFINDNLRQLNTTYLDLVLLHHRCRTPEETREVWGALEAAQLRGQIVDIGVSNFEKPDLEMLLKAARAPISVNQAHWGVGQMDFETLDFCQTHGIAVESYNTVHSIVPVSHPDILAIAANHNVTTYQATLRYVSQRGISILTATTNPQHMQEDIDIFTFNLTAAEVAKLDALQVGPRGCADCYTLECRTCRFVLDQLDCPSGFGIGNPNSTACLQCAEVFKETALNGCGGSMPMVAKACGA